MRDTSRMAFTRELKRLGFARDGTYKDPLIYVKTVGPRRLDLQLWKDGRHRVSHFLHDRMSTPPSEFRTVAAMRLAIARELKRRDHPPRLSVLSSATA